MMEKPINFDVIEQKREVVFDWVKNISEKQKVKEISRKFLKDVLEDCGANFDIGEEEKKSLKGYSEKQRAKGMNAVWGEKYKEYKDWINEYYDFNEYKKRTGKELPKLKPSGRTNSGMIQFLGELTSYAGEETNFDTFKLYIETRAINGLAWEENRKEDRVRISVPTSKKPIRPSSFPSEFPLKAFEFLVN
jgi:hypothetical protein